MLSNEHESLAELFRHQPPLAAELAAGLGADVPRFVNAKLEPSGYSDVMPTEWRSDGVVALTNDSGERVMAIVVEVQRGRPTQKRWVWPLYVTTTRARLKCRAVLLVVCPDPVIAKQSAEPIDTGHPGFALSPLVLGPDRVPVVTDPVVAQRLPELAVLSATAHGEHAEIHRIVAALVAGLASVGDEVYKRLYADSVLDVLPDAPRKHMEELMSTTYKSEFMRDLEAKAEAKAQAKAEAKAEARAEAKAGAKAVLALFAARGIDVPDDARERIANCTDVDQLDEWLYRAAAATSVKEIFD